MQRTNYKCEKCPQVREGAGTTSKVWGSVSTQWIQFSPLRNWGCLYDSWETSHCQVTRGPYCPPALAQNYSHLAESLVPLEVETEDVTNTPPSDPWAISEKRKKKQMSRNRPQETGELMLEQDGHGTLDNNDVPCIFCTMPVSSPARPVHSHRARSL